MISPDARRRRAVEHVLRELLLLLPAEFIEGLLFLQNLLTYLLDYFV